MGRNKRNTESKAHVWVAALFVLIAIFFALAGVTHAATYYHRVMGSSDGLDSIRYVFFVKAADNFDSVGTLLLTSFPDRDSIQLQEDSVYKTQEFWWWKGATNPSAVEGDPWQMTITTTIAGGYIDSNKSEQGGIPGASTTLRVVVRDTSSAGNDSLDATLLTVKNASGVTKAVYITKANGGEDLTVTDGDWTILGDKNGYIIPDSTYTVAGNDTVFLDGYAQSAVGAPAVANVCRVYGTITDLFGDSVKYADVVASLGKDVNDTCNNNILLQRRVATRTGPYNSWANGYFYLDLIRSSCLAGNKYTFTISKKGFPPKEREITVPDSATYQLIW